MKTTAHIEIPDQRIADVLITAFEGGVNYWCMIDSYREPEEGMMRHFDGSAHGIVRYCDYPLSPGGAVLIRTNENDEINGKNRWVLNTEALERGLGLLAEKFPRQFAQIVDEEDDAATADLFLQLCCFGEEVFS